MAKKPMVMPATVDLRLPILDSTDQPINRLESRTEVDIKSVINLSL